MIELQDVHKAFGPKKVLSGVNLTIGRGESLVIIGGSGNNLGAIVGGFILWIFFVEAATVGPQLMEYVTSFMADDSIIKQKLEENIAHMRYFAMGFALLLVMRFSPKGLIPERIAKGAD